MIGLTIEQARALNWIERFIIDKKMSPTFDEITEGLGLRSKSGTKRLVDGLSDRGFITVMPFHARSIKLVRMKLIGVPDAELIAELVSRGYRISGVSDDPATGADRPA